MLIDSVVELVSKPLFLRLRGVLPNDRAVCLKIEAFNPAGSIKLKTARYIVADLEKRGLVVPGSRLIESSSGNLGVAMALICAEKRYHFTCVTDPNLSPATGRVLRALGAHVVTIDRKDAQGGYLKSRLDFIMERVAADPQLVWTNQYANRANAEAHYRTTGPEILAEFPGVQWVFVGVGTAGTLAGTSRFLREHAPATRVIAVDAEGSVTFGRRTGPRHIPGIGTSLRPGLADDCVMDRLIAVREEDAVAMCWRLARESGLLVGGSTGSVLAAVGSLAQEIPQDDTVVAISPDLGERYLETVFDEEWACERFPRLRGRLSGETSSGRESLQADEVTPLQVERRQRAQAAL